MGFEPFILPRRQPTQEKMPDSASREGRVLALARLLHSRGLTSSMTDARRLAEGMVDVERKVVKQGTNAFEQGKPVLDKTDRPSDTAAAKPRTAFNITLAEDFAHFVANAAALSHEHQPVSIPESKPGKVTYGREGEERIVAEVPHASRKQVFYEDAPDITKTRGYKGPAPKPVTFETQHPDFEFQRDAAAATIGSQVTRVSTGDGGVKVVEATIAPDVEIVDERMIVEEVPAAQITPSPSASDLLKEAEEPVTTTVEEPPKEAPKPKPQESIDLFEFFRKKP